jgi:hypothetical protein
VCTTISPSAKLAAVQDHCRGRIFHAPPAQALVDLRGLRNFYVLNTLVLFFYNVTVSRRPRQRGRRFMFRYSISSILWPVTFGRSANSGHASEGMGVMSSLRSARPSKSTSRGTRVQAARQTRHGIKIVNHPRGASGPDTKADHRRRRGGRAETRALRSPISFRLRIEPDPRPAQAY